MNNLPKRMLDALEDSSATFKVYAKLHRAKNTEESTAKAIYNEEKAKALDELIAEVRAGGGMA